MMEYEQSFLMGERRFTSDRGLGVHLNYYLTKKTGRTAYDALYGIRIEKKVQGEQEETEQTPALSASWQMVEQLAGKLIDGAVTPVCMMEIIDDLTG